MKTVLITGSTDGIGKATAKKFLEENWKVYILGRNERKVNVTIDELIKATGKTDISALTADLSSLKETRNACEKFLQENQRLDLLVLNANSISNERIITKEGFERNFVIGYLSRILMIKKFENILANTPNSQILSVIGISFSRLDFNDLTIENKFTGWKGLTRWQWCMVLFVSEYCKTNKVTINLFTPGLVRTKILANEPQPMRTLVKIANILMGISVEKSANEVFYSVNHIYDNQIDGQYFMRKKQKEYPRIKKQENDSIKLMELTDSLLKAYL